MQISLLPAGRDGAVFAVVTIFIAIVFLTGGSGRSDTSSLIILWPVAMVMLFVGAYFYSWHNLRRPIDYLLLFAVVACLIPLFQLIPLPPAGWQALPGREFIAEADIVTGLASGWRPISLTPSETWASFLSLSVPMAALLLVGGLSREARFKLLTVLLALSAVNLLVCLLQVVGGSSSNLYFYRITNLGSVVGLFANRNHNAAFLSILPPLLAVFASMAKTQEGAKVRRWIAVTVCMLIVPFVLIIGSRAGLATTTAGAALGLWIYRRPQELALARRRGAPNRLRFALPALAAGGIALAAVIMSRAEALQRIFMTGGNEDFRAKFWGPVAEMTAKYFPVGSGMGSFATVFKIDEPDRLLTYSYVNQAHNDWLEIIMTAGIAGAILLLIATLAYIRAVIVLLRAPPRGRDLLFGKLGASIIFIVALASLVDYPLRIPIIQIVFVIACVWLVSFSGSQAKNVRTANERSRIEII